MTDVRTGPGVIRVEIPTDVNIEELIELLRLVERNFRPAPDSEPKNEVDLASDDLFDFPIHSIDTQIVGIITELQEMDPRLADIISQSANENFRNNIREAVRHIAEAHHWLFHAVDSGGVR